MLLITLDQNGTVMTNCNITICCYSCQDKEDQRYREVQGAMQSLPLHSCHPGQGKS